MAKNESCWVTYQGDIHASLPKPSYDIDGFPFSFHIGEPVEITQAFIEQTFNRHEPVKDFVTFLFDPTAGLYNTHSDPPRFTVSAKAPEQDAPAPAEPPATTEKKGNDA